MKQTIAQWFGFYVLDLDVVAQALATDVLREYEGVPLEYAGTIRLLKARYIRLVQACGLPKAACDAVARKAWFILERAAESVAAPEQGYSFYE
jgi:hypothetical protein